MKKMFNLKIKHKRNEICTAHNKAMIMNGNIKDIHQAATATRELLKCVGCIC